MIYTLAYANSYNLGDAIQSVAMSRLLPPTRGLYRERMTDIERGSTFIVNGYLGGDEIPPDVDKETFNIFCGVHCANPRYPVTRWLRWKYGDYIGARDRDTMLRLNDIGLSSWMCGCATVTFPRYDGPRSGVLSIDYDGPGRLLSNGLSHDGLSWALQWKMAIQRLEEIKTAAEVYTNRLHIALPCLAFGTPVFIDPAMKDNARFSILHAMGVPFGEMITMDITDCKDRFKDFLRKFYPECGPEHEPIFNAV